jgi:hypothetical protein
MKWLETVDTWKTGTETEHDILQLNADVRVGIAYNWSQYFIAVQSQFNRFSYHKDKSRVCIFDWYARLSVGLRL